jgi:signal transduction histidine kinase/CheY-like chemotaxis protein
MPSRPKNEDFTRFPTFLGMDRYRAQVLLLQSLVSIVLSYQVLITPETVLARPVQEVLVLGLLSLVAAAFLLPARLVETRAFTVILLLIDTTVTSSIIYITGQRSSDLYLAYFLIILISASMRSLWQKTAFSALIAASYGAILYATLGNELFIEGHLIRISILLIMGVVYSVMSYNLELERHDRLMLLEQITERFRTEEKLKASESLLRTLHEITVQATDWESRLRRILHVGRTSLGLSTAMVVRVTGERYEVRTILSEEVDARPGDTFPVNGSYCAWTIESREPATFSALDQSDRRPPSADPLLSPHAFAGITILVDGAVYGALCFSSTTPRPQAFAGYEKVFLKLCAQWIGHELEREAADQGIRASKEQAEAANRAKTEFLATISHEIRTPMNAIIGMADLLWDTGLSTTQKEYLGVLSRSSAHLLELIDDILDVSKIEAGQVALESVPFHLHEVLDKCAEALALRAQSKGLELIVSMAPDVPAHLLGDPRALRQVIENLLGNAIKFTERGSVCLRVSNDPATNQPGALRFAVSDTGIGIPPEKHALIFERFTQADSSTTRLFGGTGLGLSICKHLIELTGGRIWLESAVGQGTTFYFTTPFAVQTGHRDSPPPIDLGGARVYVKIDHAETGQIVREFFLSRNATVVHVTEEPSAGPRPQRDSDPCTFMVLEVTTLDDSSEHMRLITTARDQGAIVVLVIPDVRSSIIAACYRLGLGGYVTKPLTGRKLEQVLLSHMKDREKPRSSRPKEPRGERASRILMAEDSADNQRLIRAYLQQTGHTLDIAENGRLAYEMYRRGTYDLVLMDIQMPVMDGLTATTMIRQWEKTARRAAVPIIALSAHALGQEVRQSLAAGCSAHITKPVRKAALLAEIAKWLRPSTDIAVVRG